jgi:hypothetical protein
MRNAPAIFLVGGLLSICSFEESKAADAVSPTIYATPATGSAVIPRDDEPGLLPMRASDRVSLPVVDLNGPAAVPQASVEAIPTPTAFHAGGALLVVILLSRFFRKLRWA